MGNPPASDDFNQLPHHCRTSSSTVCTYYSRGAHIITRISYSLLICALLLDSVQSVKVPIPIKADEDSNQVERDRVAGCHFDNHFYELEDTWHPDLGPPFGVMYCVRCECLAFPRKGQITGKVRCRNFKLDCPKPDCPEPILLPNQCCKVCPQNSTGSRIRPENEERSELARNTNFVAVIGNRISRHLGRGTFELDAASLHYTIQLTSGFLPTLVRFQDEEGTALFTQTVDNDNLKDGKICGVWDRLPRIYKRLLVKDGLQVIVGSKQTELSGHIVGRKMNFEETFNGLLQSTDHRRMGMAGIASLALTTEGSVYEYSILLQGVPTTRKDVKQVAVVQLEKLEDGLVIKQSTGAVSLKNGEISGRFPDLSQFEN